LHPRDPYNGQFSSDLALYEEAVGLIREQNPDVILNLATGLGSGYYAKDPLLPTEAGPDTHLWPAERRVKHVLKLKPEICTFDLETAQVFGSIVVSTELQLTRMANLVQAVGVTPEIELFDSGDTVLTKHLIEMGVLRGPGICSFAMRMNFTVPADTETMMTYIRNLLPAGAHFQRFGLGRNQVPMAQQSVLLAAPCGSR
jgi:uncharacterized protein (DUF849 family)